MKVFCPIHRSAWKGYSPKFACRILHLAGPMRPETPDQDPLHWTGAMHLATRLDGYAGFWMPGSP